METVLVVGAGPTGLMLGCELLRHGLRARVVDKATEPSPLSKAIVVHARSLEVLEPLGVAMPMSTAATLADLVRGFQLIHLGRGTDLLERDLADFTRRLHAFLRAACAAHPDQETENHHDQPQT